MILSACPFSDSQYKRSGNYFIYEAKVKNYNKLTIIIISILKVSCIPSLSLVLSSRSLSLSDLFTTDPVRAELRYFGIRIVCENSWLKKSLLRMKKINCVPEKAGVICGWWILLVCIFTESFVFDSGSIANISNNGVT